VALAATKARGVKLGGPRLAHARKLAVATIEAAADQHAANVLPIIREIKKAGAATLGDIADALNARGVGTARWALVRHDGEQCVGPVCVKVFGGGSNNVA
jgi:hypothetical protein